MPDNGNEWKKFCAVPRSYPLRSFVFCFGGGNRRTFRQSGAGGDHFHCAVEPSPGHIRCRNPGLPSGVSSPWLKIYKCRDLGFSLCWIMKAKAKENVWDFDFVCVSVPCCCGLCGPNMVITEVHTKEHLGNFICLGITKAKSNLQIFICNSFRADGSLEKHGLRFVNCQYSIESKCCTKFPASTIAAKIITKKLCTKIKFRGN